jgi:hypothetical protein
MQRGSFAEAEPLLRRARGLADELNDNEIRTAVDRELTRLSTTRIGEKTATAR